MKCLVTGGSGFIGSHLIEALLAKNYEVAVVDIRKPHLDVQWINLDIRNDIKGKLKGFDVIFHLAALANARIASEKTSLAYTINVLGTLNVLKEAVYSGIERVILASTAWVAGSQVGSIVDENSPFNLLDVNTVYGSTKISQEMICISNKSEFGGPDFTILRYGIPYGERMWKGLVVRAFMDMAERHGTIHIMGDGKQYREFLYVGDLCEAQVLTLNSSSNNKVYYLTGNQPITVEELAHEVQKHFPSNIEYIPQARIEPKLRRIKNDLAKKELGWQTNTSLSEGIQKCADWWKSLSDKQKSEDYWAY
ncbi:MAG: NAD(P)-dependent oxidoreductase [Anaerolineales bacterium]